MNKIKMLSERDSNIFNRILSGEKQSHVARELKLTSSRVFQIYHKAERSIRLGYYELFDPEKKVEEVVQVDLPSLTRLELLDIRHDLYVMRDSLKEILRRIESVDIEISNKILSKVAPENKNDLYEKYGSSDFPVGSMSRIQVKSTAMEIDGDFEMVTVSESTGTFLYGCNL